MRIEDDSELISYIEEEKQKGLSTSEIFKAAIEKLKED